VVSLKCSPGKQIRLLHVPETTFRRGLCWIRMLAEHLSRLMMPIVGLISSSFSIRAKHPAACQADRKSQQYLSRWYRLTSVLSQEIVAGPDLTAAARPSHSAFPRLPLSAPPVMSSIRLLAMEKAAMPTMKAIWNGITCQSTVLAVMLLLHVQYGDLPTQPVESEERVDSNQLDGRLVK